MKNVSSSVQIHDILLKKDKKPHVPGEFLSNQTNLKSPREICFQSHYAFWMQRKKNGALNVRKDVQNSEYTVQLYQIYLQPQSDAHFRDSSASFF